MPPFSRKLDGTIDLFIELAILGKQRVEPLRTDTSMKNSLRDLILDQKEERMKLKEYMIIESNAMNGKEIL